MLTTTNPSLLLTPRETAQALNISEKTLWSYSQPRGPIPTIRFGRSVRYSRAALERMLVEQEASNGRGQDGGQG